MNILYWNQCDSLSKRNCRWWIWNWRRKNGSVFNTPDIWWERVGQRGIFILLHAEDNNNLQNFLYWKYARFYLETLDDDECLSFFIVYKTGYHYSFMLYFWKSRYYKNIKLLFHFMVHHIGKNCWIPLTDMFEISISSSCIIFINILYQYLLAVPYLSFIILFLFCFRF